MADSLSGYDVLLCHFDGANGDLATVDATGRHAMVFSSASTMTLSDTNAVFGTTGLLARGTSSSFASVPWIEADNLLEDFDFGDGDFCIELWHRFDAGGPSGTQELVSYATPNDTSANGTGWLVRTINSGTSPARGAYLQVYAGTTQYIASVPAALDQTTGVKHLAFERVGGTLYAYCNGVVGSQTAAIGTAFLNGLSGNGGRMRIGNNRNAGLATVSFYGMVDELRITKGASRYGGVNFTPPSSAFDDPAPVAPPAQEANGFCNTAFGTPSLANTATGLSVTAFGTPSVRHVAHAAGFASPAFGLALALATRLEQASGFSLTRFGGPTAYGRASATADTIASARFIASARVRFGLPRALLTPPPCEVQTLGPLAQFGTPAARQVHRLQATGGDGTLFGQARANLRAHASGARALQFGSPAAAHGAHAASLPPVARFGTPLVWWAHRATGREHTQFGRPAGRLSTVCPASGFSSAQFGTPSAFQLHHPQALGRITHFGTPIVQRGSAC